MDEAQKKMFLAHDNVELIPWYSQTHGIDEAELVLPINITNAAGDRVSCALRITEYDIASLCLVSRECACARRPGLPQACRSG